MSRNNLARFELIVATDSQFGISSKGKIPWQTREGSDFFEAKTKGNGRNVVIVGRITFETLFGGQNLRNREVFVLSKTWRQADHTGVFVFPSLREALAMASNDNYDKTFICGGGKLFKEVVGQWMYLCDKIHITKHKMDYRCDVFFPGEIIEDLEGEENRNQIYIRTSYDASVFHHRESDMQELLLRLVAEGGIMVEKHLYGAGLEFELGEKFPLITTNMQNPKGLLHAVLFGVKGGCDAHLLEELGCDFFTQITSKEAHASAESGLLVGDIGPWWGYHLTNWGRPYRTCEDIQTDPGFNQLDDLVTKLKSKDRSGMVYLSNPSGISAVYPSRYASLSVVLNHDRTVLTSVFVVEKCDALREIGQDIFTGALLTHIIALLVGATPGGFKIIFIDLYSTHRTELEKQAARTPLPFGNLLIKNPGRMVKTADLDPEKFVFSKYDFWPAITPRPEEVMKISLGRPKKTNR